MPPSTFEPLMRLHATRSRDCPVVCIPGAGASLTTFVDFTDALGSRWPIYGLQPRGTDLAEPPHESVEAAALCNLNAVVQLNTARRLHLVGHSHGGLVAFEMALRLQEQGQPVASLTLIDSDPPDSIDAAAPPRSSAQIFREFVEAFEGILDRPLDIDEAVVMSDDVERFVRALHATLVSAKYLPARSTPNVLRGPLATFAAALRCTYIPSHRYDATLHLVLVSTRGAGPLDDMARRESHAARWRGHAAALDVWHGPGHHFSILRVPHVLQLADWWRGSRDREGR